MEDEDVEEPMSPETEAELVRLMEMLAKKVKPENIDVSEWTETDEDEPSDEAYLVMEEEVADENE